MKTAMDVVRAALTPRAIEIGIADMVNAQKTSGRDIGCRELLRDVVGLSHLCRMVRSGEVKVPV